MKEQKFLAYAVYANGAHLWKSMMHDRYRWVKARAEQVKGFGDIGVVDDLELDKQMKTFLSRKLSNEDKEYRKVLKNIQERYNSYFKGKTPF